MLTRSRRAWTAMALAASVALITRAPAADACAPFELTTAMLGAQTEIASDGGLVMVQVRAEGRGNIGGPGVQVDGKAVELETVYVASGLELWRVKAAPGAAVTVVDREGTVAATLAVTRPHGRLRAPTARTASSTVNRPPTTRMAQPGAPYTTLSITLARPLPADAVALVVYGHDRRGVNGLAWSAVTAGATTFEIGGGGKGCGGGAPPIYAGDRLSFAWVDARGRLSPRSAVRTVGLTRARTGP